MTGASEGEIMFALGCVVAVVAFGMLALFPPGGNDD